MKFVDDRAWSDPDVPFTSMDVVTDDGARLHVRSYGSDDLPVIVFVHGHNARLEYWNPQINTLADRYRVVAYDQRGFGRSTVGERGVGTDAIAGDLEAVLAATVPADQRAVLVGHSFGGIAVLAWSKSYPDSVDKRVSAVLLANTIAERFHATSRLIPFAGHFAWIRRPIFHALGRMQRAVNPNPLVRFFFRFFWAPAANTRAADFLLRLSVGVNVTVSRAWSVALAGLKLTQGVSNLSVPTSVIVGSRDRAMPRVASARIADGLRETGNLHRFVEVKGVGHCTNVEALTVFNDEVVRLAVLRRGASQLAAESA